MKIEKFNWKTELKKRSFKDFPKELLFMLCISITTLTLLFSQTDKQLELIQSLIYNKSWIILTLICIGVIILSAVLEKIIKFVFGLVVVVVRLFKK